MSEEIVSAEPVQYTEPKSNNSCLWIMLILLILLLCTCCCSLAVGTAFWSFFSDIFFFGMQSIIFLV